MGSGGWSLWALAAAALVAACGGGGASRPRGVPLSKAPLYAPGDRFTCLDGSYTIPYSFVNDDYCDCRDGTDEPGTSACVNGLFHCANVGHEPLDIPSSRVNDGVCDCCDASDEYAGGGCVDRCEELGKEARIEAARRASLLRAGAKMRADLIRDGAAAKAEMKERLEELRKNRREAEQLRAERERFKADAEELERAALEKYTRAEEEERRARNAAEDEGEARRTFAELDADADGRLTVAEMKERAEFDLDGDGAVADEEAQSLLGDNLSVSFEEFSAVARKAIEERLNRPAEPETEIEAPEPETESEGDEGEDGDIETDGGEPENEEEPQEEDAEPEDAREPTTPPSARYDEETQKLIDAASEARSVHSKADGAVRDIDGEIETLERTLEKDCGPEGEFATLAGKCLEFADREYVYKLCPFDRASQRPKSGGSETDLGRWGDWTGEGGDRYSSMIYSRGASCWNGPDRSARIEIRCGLEDRIVSVSEPNRCEYVFEMETPAACVEAETDGSRHDEL